MSWLNTSLNTIKGQLTSLANEVLAETAGPGDEEYHANDIDERTALQLLAETQNDKEKLHLLCGEKDKEILNLRQQIEELQQKHSDRPVGGPVAASSTGGGNSDRTSKSPSDNNNALEDSWCWELENAKNDNENSSETSSGNGNEPVNLTFEEVSLDTAKTNQRKQCSAGSENNGELQKRIQDLEDENKQLNVSLDELDTQHNLAMQNVLDTKTQLQEKLSNLSAKYESLKLEQSEKFINSELELGRIKKQCELLQEKQQIAETEKNALEKKLDNYAEELKRSIEEMADLQALLDKKNQDNVELIERVQAVKQDLQQAVIERSELAQQVEQLLKEVDDLKAVKEKKTSESSSSSNSKQSEDEFIVVREGEVSSTSTTPPSKEKLKDKIVQLEDRVSELTLENGSLNLKLQNCEMEKQLTADVFKENLQEMQEKYDEQQQHILVLNEQLQQLQQQVQEYREKTTEHELLQKQLNLLGKEKVELTSKLSTLNELEKRLLMAEQEKEVLQLELQGMRLARDRVNELEGKMQQLTIEHQQLQLNVGAETESNLNTNEELEEKLKKLSEENESMRIELEHMAHEKFRQAIAEEKQEITDLDDEEEEEAFSLNKVHDLLKAYVQQHMNDGEEQALEKSYKTISERLARVNSLEQNLSQMSEQLIDLENCKLVWNHEKKTLEADISQYILQCEELMKNNEILLNELENLKRNKLETISEHNEENILQLEMQLEESQKLNKSLESEYAELQQKQQLMQLEKDETIKQLQSVEQQNQQLQEQQQQYLLQLQDMELQNAKAQCELNVLAQERTEDAAKNAEILLDANAKVTSLEQQLEMLNKDHADLVYALNAQKQKLIEANKAREEQQSLVDKQLSQIAAMSVKLQDHGSSEIKAVESLKTELEAKDVLLQELNQKLSVSEKECNGLKEIQSKHDMLVKQLQEYRDTMSENEAQLEAKQLQLENLQETNASLLEQIGFYSTGVKDVTQLQEQIDNLHAELNDLYQLSAKQTTELETLKESSKLDVEAIDKIVQLEAQLMSGSGNQQIIDALNEEKQEMLKALQQKHAENLQYYAEIQRLQPIVQQLQQQLDEAKALQSQQCDHCSTLQIQISELTKDQEKLKDQINFLKEKSDILTTNLLTEQTNQKLVRQEKLEVEEQNNILRKDLERLRQHLLEIEELHTQETVELQTELDKTSAKMIELQSEVSKSSNAYTSASIRANQHAETLQAQYALLVQQRDELVAKLGLAEDRESKNQAALCNLQCALEQFQNDKESDIKAATLRIRRELQLEMEKQSQLQRDVANVQQQLAEANQGLAAASRLSDQLEASQQAVAALREEVDTLKQQNEDLSQQLNSNESTQADKIDKSLIKSLLIGYVVSSNANDKVQVLRMISSVLDFTQSETDKVGLNKQQSSWLGSLLGVGDTQGSGQQHKDNLVQAFVQFLEQESQPKVNVNNMPNLLNITQSNSSAAITATTTSAAATMDAIGNAGSVTPTRRISNASQSGHFPLPIQLNSNVLNEFAPTRNSSSILKDILNDV